MLLLCNGVPSILGKYVWVCVINIINTCITFYLLDMISLYKCTSYIIRVYMHTYKA